MKIGVLAYGSLIDDPGAELRDVIVSTINNVKTPFRVEYARSSQTRGGAPTLIPVDSGGAEVNAVVFVLRDDVSVEMAMDLVWRRETGKYGKEDRYRPKTQPRENTVQVQTLSDFAQVKTVLYTWIGSNIENLNGEELARLAIASVQSPDVPPGKDGISYLINAVRNQIETPLSNAYRQAILRLTGTGDLPAALEHLTRAQAVTAFCEDCVWARSIRTHFAELFERNDRRHVLLQESAAQLFGDLNLVLIDYLLLQQAKLLDPASSGKGKLNLTTNYLLTLNWTAETRAKLTAANDTLLQFKGKIQTARNQLVAHTDLRTRLGTLTLGTFLEADEETFWNALQEFVSAAHGEALGGPFEIDATMQGGDALSLLHRLADAVDYDDMTKGDPGLLQRRAEHRRFDRL